MTRRSLWSLSLSLFAAGCTCGAYDPNTTRFVCSTNDDCAPGYVCAPRDGDKECVLGGGVTGGGGGSLGGGGGAAGGGGGDLGGGGGATGGGGGDMGGGGGSTGGGGGSTGGGGGSTGGGGGSTGGGGGATGGGGGATGGGGGSTGGGGGATGGGGGATGGGGGGGGGGATGGGGGSLPASRLAFTTAPQVVYTNSCSGAVGIQLRNASDQAVTAPAPLTVTLSSMGLLGLTFYASNNCGSPGNDVVIPAGSSNTTVWFRASIAGQGTITASALPLTPASQSVTASQPPTSLIFSSPAPAPPVLAGTCFAATVQARSSLGTATAVSSNSTVSLQATPSGSLRYFSDSACTSQIASTTILAGETNRTFYVKAISGGGASTTATASFGSATQNLTVTRVVRRGECTMGGTQSATTCNISEPHQSLTRTMLVYQVTSGAGAPRSYQIRCKLTDLSTISCQREGTGNSVTISWQTAELPQGLTVQRLSASTCPPAATALPLAPPVDPARSFVLASFAGKALGGVDNTNFDADDLSVARLSSDGQSVRIEPSANEPCGGYELQVVTFDGASVVRGGGSIGVGVRQGTSVPALLPPAPANTTMLLNSVLASSVPMIDTRWAVCNFLVRAWMPSTTTVQFSRGSTNNNIPDRCSLAAIADVPWERIDFGSRARVQAFHPVIITNSTQLTTGGIDPTRTLVFAGGQLSVGQATGEIANDNEADDEIGMGAVRFSFDLSGSVRVERGQSQGAATFSIYVVELEP